ncbi:MAG: DUF4263 domain-containing protein [Candidatus Pacebacteria bacterium]|nr:DUF4263 domain-containing protein [Candidatus Paceibacterota bacterium]
MPEKKNRREEYLESTNEDKEIYFFIDEFQKINIKSREVYIKTNKVIHHPFNKSGNFKYKKITEIIYEGLPDPLPRGFIKDWRLGYGFTKVLNPILYLIETKFDVSKVVVKPKGKFMIKNRTVYLSYEDLNKFYPKMDTLMKVQSSQKEALVSKYLSQYLPTEFKDSKQKYIKGSIYSIVTDQIGKDGSISKDDYDAMLELVVSKSSEQTIESKKIVLATKEKIEKIFLEDGVKDFKKILILKSVSGGFEKKWEQFFKENTWIISNLFSLPALLFANQAYVGGKEIFNTNGKVTDFLFRNKLTDNLAIIELKTHKTELLSKKPYRGDDVYSLSEELSGAVNQVLDQRQNLLNDFYALRCKTGNTNQFESYNSRCLIIAGKIEDLPKNGKRSFEIFRNNLHGVEIVTFDEVLEKMETFVSLIKTDAKKRKR